MKDFRQYDIPDFVMDEDFIRWIHDKGQADNIFWQNWLQKNPTKASIVAEARQIVESIRMEQRPVDPREVRMEIDQVLRKIRHEKEQGETAIQGRMFRMRRMSLRIAVAAAILLLVMAGIQLFRTEKSDRKLDRYAYEKVVMPASFTEKINHTPKTQTLTLPDGSIIELAPQSRLSYPNGFATAGTRDIYLSGEAFFKIAKNPSHPFRVFANEIITKVLGTSFSVRCYEKDTTISVTVRTGKVSVYSQEATAEKRAVAGKPDGIIVSPNQQLVYQRFEQKFQKVLIEEPLFIVPDTVDRSMIYEDKPVEQVFDQLGKYYGINIVYDSDLLNKCTVTADLTNEPFYHKLDLICKAIGARYELMDGQVVIQSNGCQ